LTQQSEGQSKNTDMCIAEAFLLFQTNLLPNNETQQMNCAFIYGKHLKWNEALHLVQEHIILLSHA
jgi:hypothetical protein